MKYFAGLTAFLMVFSLLLTADGEARIGGGRSSGMRGSRGFGTSQRSQPPRSGGSNSMPQQSIGGSPMMRGLIGGLAGGFIGSMLFRNMSNAGDGQTSEGGGFGFLELIVLAALCFFAFRFFTQRKMAAATSPVHAGIESFDSEQDYAQTLQRSNRAFDLNQFKEERMDDFLRIQTAWNSRDLSSVANLITSDLKRIFDADIETLKTAKRINRLENIAVRNTSLVESWLEAGKEYATLKFQAQLLDYTLDENTQLVVDGDRTQPVKFQEEWTYVRNTEAGANQWALSAIVN